MNRNFLKNSLSALMVSLSLLTSSPHALAQTYKEVEWIELMPKDDLDALLNPPEYLNEITDGSEQDTLDALGNIEATDKQAKRYQSALESKAVIESFDGENIRLPGFVVPLENNEEQKIIEFFIVPYFGACLHMPPPPPNQMIFVRSAEGIELESLYDAFWFEGTVHIKTMKNEVGTAAYTLELANMTLYEE
ncbi:DUF3299 domain-containing protein [Pseudoalteromonas ruthenica]|uniref:DUF3299 domain-containing protein n=1 Tax=Pseudoalteromonas ruthenica TaxID=151081 RepID=UPI00110B0AA5|nr:DUF3299 domain-containing protein [Pseudoalteromonas ruthenica]TMO46450.1 DUF3299 domain-containing protein [Pseudoalteromonas ruthenica]TMO50379.1 DUF3299 domain-containing protein [Pseudoalteromonas ruthenica]